MDEFVSLLVGPVVSALVSWMKGRNLPDGVKVLILLTVSLAFGGLITWSEGKLDGVAWTRESLLSNLGLIFISATAFYHTYFKNTESETKLERNGPLANVGTPPPALPSDFPPVTRPVAPLTEEEWFLVEQQRLRHNSAPVLQPGPEDERMAQ
jgi:hypothetical protein